MRLDLLRYNCLQFSLSGEVRVTRDQVAEVHDVMSQTVQHRLFRNEEDIEIVQASFGSRSKMRYGTYRIRALLMDSPDESGHDVSLELDYDLAAAILPPPPRRLRPVSVLIDNAFKLGVVSVNCEALFEYAHSDGYISSVQLPIPLMLQDEAKGITHIESAQFSSRSREDVLHTVLVMPNPEKGTFGHVVEFSKDVQLNRATIRALFDEAVSISSRLVYRTREE